MKSVTIIIPILASLAFASTTPTKRATGVFEYTYTDASDTRKLGLLDDPQSGKCINIPEAADNPADSPINLTAQQVVLFLDKNCDGDVYYTLKAGGSLGQRLKVRSVVFA